MTAVSALTMTGGEAVVQALRAHGVELVFGIPAPTRCRSTATSPRAGSAT